MRLESLFNFIKRKKTLHDVENIVATPVFVPEQLEPRLLLSAVCDIDDELARPLTESYQPQIPAITVEQVPGQETIVEQFDADSTDADENPTVQNPLETSDDVTQIVTAEEDSVGAENVIQDVRDQHNLSADQAEVLPLETEMLDDDSSGRIDFIFEDSYTEQLAQTLLAANPPPAQQTSFSYFVFEAQPGNNNLTLRLNAEDNTIVELVDSETVQVLASCAVDQTTKVVSYG